MTNRQCSGRGCVSSLRKWSNFTVRYDDVYVVECCFHAIDRFAILI